MLGHHYAPYNITLILSLLPSPYHNTDHHVDLVVTTPACNLFKYLKNFSTTHFPFFINIFTFLCKASLSSCFLPYLELLQLKRNISKAWTNISCISCCLNMEDLQWNQMVLSLAMNTCTWLYTNINWSIQMPPPPFSSNLYLKIIPNIPLEIYLMSSILLI